MRFAILEGFEFQLGRFEMGEHGLFILSVLAPKAFEEVEALGGLFQAIGVGFDTLGIGTEFVGRFFGLDERGLEAFHEGRQRLIEPCDGFQRLDGRAHRIDGGQFAIDEGVEGGERGLAELFGVLESVQFGFEQGELADRWVCGFDFLDLELKHINPLLSGCNGGFEIF